MNVSLPPAEAKAVRCPICSRHLGVLEATYAELPQCKGCGFQTTLRAASRIARQAIETPAGPLEVKGG